jgi:hypothetical protein
LLSAIITGKTKEITRLSEQYIAYVPLITEWLWRHSFCIKLPFHFIQVLQYVYRFSSNYDFPGHVTNIFSTFTGRQLFKTYFKLRCSVIWQTSGIQRSVVSRSRPTASCLHNYGDEWYIALYIEEVRTSETSVYFNKSTRGYIRPPAETKDFSSNLCVQTGSGAHSASCAMGTGGHFPGDKVRPGRDAAHLPHPVPRSWMSRSYISFPPAPPEVCCETALLVTSCYNAEDC